MSDLMFRRQTSKKESPDSPKNTHSNQRPRLVDVAKASGVATNTASMILNQRSNCWASEATKKKVKDAQDALILQLRQFKPRQPVEFPVLVKIKFAVRVT